jgi:putative Holliday junction resolvase
LALDVGDRRIGVALSDPTGTIASPLLTIHRVAERKDHQVIADLVVQHSVERVVIGLPWTLRGELGPQAARVMRFGERLSPLLKVPVDYWDERHSTTEAEGILRGRRRKRGDRTGLDEVAAAVILQGYLDSMHSARGAGSPAEPSEPGTA